MPTKKATSNKAGKPAAGKKGTGNKTDKPSPDQQPSTGLPGEKPILLTGDQEEFDRIRQSHLQINNKAILEGGLPETKEGLSPGEDDIPGTVVSERVKAFAEEHGLPESEAFEIMKQQGLLDDVMQRNPDYKGKPQLSPEELQDLKQRAEAGTLTDEEIITVYQSQETGLSNEELVNKYREQFKPHEEATEQQPANGKPGIETEEAESEEGKPRRNRRTFTFICDDEEADYLEAVLAERMKKGMSKSKNHFLRQVVNVGLNTDFDHQLGLLTDDTLKIWNPIPKVYFKEV